MNIKMYLAGKRFLKGFIASGVASTIALAGIGEYQKIFLIAILTAILQAIEKFIKEIEKEKQ
jgi:hypothetical protein